MKLVIRIIRHDEGVFMGVCPSLPGCVTRGRSRDEVERRLAEAIRGYFAAMNNFVPENVTHEVVEV